MGLTAPPSVEECAEVSDESDCFNVLINSAKRSVEGLALVFLHIAVWSGLLSHHRKGDSENIVQRIYFLEFRIDNR